MPSFPKSEADAVSSRSPSASRAQLQEYARGTRADGTTLPAVGVHKPRGYKWGCCFDVGVLIALAIRYSRTALEYICNYCRQMCALVEAIKAFAGVHMTCTKVCGYCRAWETLGVVLCS